MNRDEVIQFHAGTVETLLTALRNAATGLVPSYADNELQVGPAGYATVLQRSSSSGGYTWLCELGFENGNDLIQNINWRAPQGQFPTLQMPIKLIWTGNDQWGVGATEEVPVQSIKVARGQVSWLGKSWPNATQVDATWIIRTLLDNWLLQESPAAAREHVLLALPGARWERVRPLGGWGPTDVWVVRDLTAPTAPHAVMKSLRTKRGPGSTAHKRLVREIEITRELAHEHPGIVPVLDFGVPQDGDEWKPFYVMPLADATLAKTTNFKENVESVLRLAIQLADALAAAHDRSVVHRDVKPDNILLMVPDRRPVVADFGICFLASEEADRLTATEAGTVGPADYVAPELLGGRADTSDIDGRADIYSLGKTLYYAYSGGEIFPREYFAEDKYDLRKRFNDARTQHLYGLLERMVVENREGRFSSMRECLEALRRALDNIKNGSRYEAGMYGRVATPLEVMERFTRDLQVASGAARYDLLRSTLDDAKAQLQSAVAPLDDTRLSGGEALMMRGAFAGGEGLMAVGLPLLKANDPEGFDRWLETLVGLLHATEPGDSARSTSTVRAAAVLAFHGVAATALETERHDLLRVMLDRYLEHRSRLAHVAKLGSTASRSWEWLEGCLPKSAILARLEPKLIPKTKTALCQVAGLAVLRFILSLDAQEMAQALPVEGELHISTLPGLLPQACEWVESLPESLMAAPSRERAIADRVFGISPEAFRRECKRITPSLARALLWMADKIRRSPEWVSGLPRKGRWTQWCGGDW